VAAVWLAQEFGLPVVVTARGTDLNLIPEYRIPRLMIQRAARAADGLITVCEALKTRLSTSELRQSASLCCATAWTWIFLR